MVKVKKLRNMKSLAVKAVVLYERHNADAQVKR